MFRIAPLDPQHASVETSDIFRSTSISRDGRHKEEPCE
jgi:hypothetical protein